MYYVSPHDTERFPPVLAPTTHSWWHQLSSPEDCCWLRGRDIPSSMQASQLAWGWWWVWQLPTRISNLTNAKSASLTLCHNLHNLSTCRPLSVVAHSQIDHDGGLFQGSQCWRCWKLSPAWHPWPTNTCQILFHQTSFRMMIIIALKNTVAVMEKFPLHLR